MIIFSDTVGVSYILSLMCFICNFSECAGDIYCIFIWEFPLYNYNQTYLCFLYVITSIFLNTLFLQYMYAEDMRLVNTHTYMDVLNKGNTHTYK